MKCPACSSTELVAGHIPGADGDATNGFQPFSTKLLAKAFMRKVRLIDGEKFYACKNCGLVWGRVDKDELAGFVSNHTKAGKDTSNE